MPKKEYKNEYKILRFPIKMGEKKLRFPILNR